MLQPQNYNFGCCKPIPQILEYIYQSEVHSHFVIKLPHICNISDGWQLVEGPCVAVGDTWVLPNLLSNGFGVTLQLPLVNASPACSLKASLAGQPLKYVNFSISDSSLLLFAKKLKASPDARKFFGCQLDFLICSFGNFTHTLSLSRIDDTGK